MKSLPSKKKLFKEMNVIASKYLELTIYPTQYPTQNLFHNNNFVCKVDHSFYLQNSLFQELLNNDFFYQNYPDWWQGVYSKKEYQLMKLMAVTSFLSAFYEM